MKDIKETKHTIYLSTDGKESACSICNFQFTDYHNLSYRINHYIGKHGYTLLHVGQETGTSDKGKPWHDTVAILAIP